MFTVLNGAPLNDNTVGLWADGVPVIGEAVTSGEGVRWKVGTGQCESRAESSLDGDQVTIYRGGVSRKIPAQARTWISESRIDLLRVRQVPAKAAAVARSSIRILPNTALGRGEMVAIAEAADDTLKINLTRDARGQISSEAVLSMDPSRIRVFKSGAAIGVAESHLSPTVIRNGTAYSYFSGVAEASAASLLIDTVIRRPGQMTVIGQAIEQQAQAFLRRGMQGVCVGLASSGAVGRQNRHRFAVGQAEAQADLPSTWLRYRPAWPGVSEASASSSLTPLVLKRAEGVSAGEAESASTGLRRAIAYGSPLGRAQLSIEAEGRRGVLMTGAIEAEAETFADGLKDVWFVGAPAEAIGVALKFLYRVNIDDEAPDIRTIKVEGDLREVSIPFSSREYLVE